VEENEVLLTTSIVIFSAFIKKVYEFGSLIRMGSFMLLAKLYFLCKKQKEEKELL